MEPLRVGVIGIGSRGSGVLKTMLTIPEIRITALADIVQERAGKPASEIGVPFFTSYRDLIASGLAEAIIVATPHPSHAPITIAAAQHGLHILCEKPIAVRVSEADAMCRAAKQADVVLGIMFQRRLEPVYQKAKALIDADEIGAIYDVDVVSTGWYRLQSYYDSGDWRATWAGEGGGILANQSPHDLDLLTWLAGVPHGVKATLRTRIHRIETENTVYAILEYEGNKIGSYKATTAYPNGRRAFDISGECGRIIIENGKLLHCRYQMPTSEHIQHAQDVKSFQGEWQELPLVKAGDTTRSLIVQFVKAVRYGESPVATGEDGLRALELANAMHLSGLTEAAATIPCDRAAVDRLFADLTEQRLRLAR